jgi:hypothetical protein
MAKGMARVTWLEAVDTDEVAGWLAGWRRTARRKIDRSAA